MKVQIRQGVFETNSSSTHAVSVCTKTQWEDYKSGKLWLDNNLDFLPAAEAEEYNNKLIAKEKERCEKHGRKFDKSNYEDDLYHSYDDGYDGYSYDEMARALGISKTNLSTKISRIKRQARKKL